MSYSLQDNTELTALGDAIRAKTGDSGAMTVAQMAAAVADISNGNPVFTIQETGWHGTTNQRLSAANNSDNKNIKTYTINPKDKNYPFFIIYGLQSSSYSTPPTSFYFTYWDTQTYHEYFCGSGSKQTNTVIQRNNDNSYTITITNTNTSASYDICLTSKPASNNDVYYMKLYIVKY